MVMKQCRGSSAHDDGLAACSSDGGCCGAVMHANCEEARLLLIAWQPVDSLQGVVVPAQPLHGSLFEEIGGAVMIPESDTSTAMPRARQVVQLAVALLCRASA